MPKTIAVRVLVTTVCDDGEEVETEVLNMRPEGGFDEKRNTLFIGHHRPAEPLYNDAFGPPCGYSQEGPVTFSLRAKDYTNDGKRLDVEEKP